MGILLTIIIGFVAGIIAKFLYPGPNEPQGFIPTTILGIVGAFAATFIGQAFGWYRAHRGRWANRSSRRRCFGAFPLRLGDETSELNSAGGAAPPCSHAPKVERANP